MSEEFPVYHKNVLVEGMGDDYSSVRIEYPRLIDLKPLPRRVTAVYYDDEVKQLIRIEACYIGIIENHDGPYPGMLNTYAQYLTYSDGSGLFGDLDSMDAGDFLGYEFDGLKSVWGKEINQIEAACAKRREKK